jgi:hypothetical protein
VATDAETGNVGVEVLFDDVGMDDAFGDIGMGVDVDAAVEDEESVVELLISTEVDDGSSSIQLFDRSQLAEFALLRANARLQGSEMDSEDSEFDEDEVYGGLENMVVPIAPLGGMIPNPPVSTFHGGQHEYLDILNLLDIGLEILESTSIFPRILVMPGLLCIITLM